VLNLQIIRRVLNGKPWISVGRLHGYVNFLKCTLGNGLGKLYATGCEDLTIWVVDHVREITDKKQRTDMGNYCFVNRTIRNWNQLPAEALGHSLVNIRFLEKVY